MVNIIGMGPGDKEQITFAAIKTIKESEILIGAKRMLEPFSKGNIETLDISIGLDKIVDFINTNYLKKEITVLASGDTGFYSIANTLNQKLSLYIPLNFLPGISSLQYFCSKIKISWHDMIIVSLHGRDDELIDKIKNNKKIFLLTGGKNSAESILDLLFNEGLGDLEVYIGENLSYDSETIINGKVYELVNRQYSPLSVILIINNMTFYNNYSISDLEFIRGTVPMTKEEVRAVSISKLQLNKDDIVYDIGAGTGSISIECALHAKRVYSIEFNPEALELIKLNKKKFNIYNMEIVEGKAPDILIDLPNPTKVFIGGSTQDIANILKIVIAKNQNVKIVINAIMIETVNKAIEYLNKLNFTNIDVAQIGVSKFKKVNLGNMLIANNPIFIITAQVGTSV